MLNHLEVNEKLCASLVCKKFNDIVSEFCLDKIKLTLKSYDKVTVKRNYKNLVVDASFRSLNSRHKRREFLDAIVAIGTKVVKLKFLQKIESDFLRDVLSKTPLLEVLECSELRPSQQPHFFCHSFSTNCKKLKVSVFKSMKSLEIFENVKCLEDIEIETEKHDFDSKELVSLLTNQIRLKKFKFTAGLNNLFNEDFSHAVPFQLTEFEYHYHNHTMTSEQQTNFVAFMKTQTSLEVVRFDLLFNKSFPVAVFNHVLTLPCLRSVQLTGLSPSIENHITGFAEKCNLELKELSFDFFNGNTTTSSRVESFVRMFPRIEKLAVNLYYKRIPNELLPLNSFLFLKSLTLQKSSVRSLHKLEIPNLESLTLIDFGSAYVDYYWSLFIEKHPNLKEVEINRLVPQEDTEDVIRKIFKLPVVERIAISYYEVSLGFITNFLRIFDNKFKPKTNELKTLMRQHATIKIVKIDGEFLDKNFLD